jgi:hypothetical protein
MRLPPCAGIRRCRKLVMGTEPNKGLSLRTWPDKASKPVSQLPSSKCLKWTPDLTTQVNERRRKKPSTVSFEKQNKEGKSRSRSNRRKEGWSRYDTILRRRNSRPVHTAHERGMRRAAGNGSLSMPQPFCVEILPDLSFRHYSP